MVEETEQIKKQKKEKQSSADMVDSFFTSHEFDNEQSNQQSQRDFHETEQLIDKLLNNESLHRKQDESLSPSVEIVEKTHQQTSTDPKEITSNHEDLQKWNPVFESHEKEEIFELDHPESTKPVDKPKVKHVEKKQEKKTLTFFEQNKPQSQKNKPSKKNSFSIHLPKFNVKLKKSTNEPKMESNQQEQTVEFKEVKHYQTTPLEEKTETRTGRIHGIAQTFDTPPSNKLVETKKQKEKQKTSFFKSTDKSHFLFKKKSDEKQTKTRTEKQDSSNQKKSEPVQPAIEESEPSEQVTTISGSVDTDLIQLLKITDDLLGKLPDEVIEEFSQSEDFALYEKVMKKYDILK